MISVLKLKSDHLFKDLHSGVFGGAVHEAMVDLVYMLNLLVDKDGKYVEDLTSLFCWRLRTLQLKLTYTFKDSCGWVDGLCCSCD